jgi:uncharacterized protein (TIGR02117 family)
MSSKNTARMLATFRLVLQVIFYGFFAVLGLGLLYYGVAKLLERVPVPAEATTEAATIPFYIHSNGVHTDLVMPVRTAVVDWSQELLYAHTTSADTTYRFVGIGWGDKGFYLDTPEWKDLTLGTAVRAGFWLSTTAMHVTYFRKSELTPGPNCAYIPLTPTQYRHLVAYVQNTFQRDAQGRVEWLPNHSYADHDAFYNAKYRYSVLNTCNTWSNNGLKVAGQKAALWTAFDSGLLRQYAEQTGR